MLSVTTASLLLMCAWPEMAGASADNATADVHVCPTDCTCASLPGDSRRRLSVECRYFFPNGLPVGTSSLQLKSMGEALQVLGPGIFKIPNNQNLARLNVDSQVEALAANAFADVPRLVELDLSYNKISNISKAAFSGLHGLETLLLSYNRIAFIPEGAFNDLTSLHALYMDSNALTVIPTPLPVSLKILNLRRNQISSINAPANESWVMPRLTQLDLCQNNFTSFSNPPFSISAMEILCLGNNPMTIDPKTLGNMRKLESLDLNADLAPSSPTLDKDVLSAISSLSELQVFRADKYSFTDFSVFSHLPSLTSLTVNKMPEDKVANLETLLTLKKLHSIQLNESPGIAAALLSTPALIPLLKKLSSLAMARSSIQKFPQLPRDVFANLQQLDISLNPIACECTLEWVKARHDSGQIFLRRPRDTHCYNASLENYVLLIENEFTCQEVGHMPDVKDVQPSVAQKTTATSLRPTMTSSASDVQFETSKAEPDSKLTGTTISATAVMSDDTTSAVAVTPTPPTAPTAKGSMINPASARRKGEEGAVTEANTTSIVISITALVVVGLLAAIVTIGVKIRADLRRRQSTKEECTEAETGSDQVTYSKLGPGDD